MTTSTVLGIELSKISDFRGSYPFVFGFGFAGQPVARNTQEEKTGTGC
jgi:hypothetical protein